MTSREPIALVGASCIFPGSLDETGFWRDILAGRDLITDVPPTHWLIDDYYDPDPQAPDKTYSKRGAFLPPIDFDPMAFGVPPSIVPATDTTQLLALVVAQRVLDDATRANGNVDRERVSVILGVTSAQELLGSMVSRLQHPIWRKALRETGLPESKVEEACKRIAACYVPWQESTFPGVLGNVVAGRIANRLDLHGTNCVTDAACASSFSAVSMAVNELLLGQSDLVIAGGCDTMNDIFMYMCFSKTPALSKSGDCRPFSASGDGTMLGEGLAMVALKRLSDAERDGDRIYALLKGVGASSDGRSKSVYAPVAEGQARALRRTYEQAGYGPETVELVEAHGTGTVAGDAAEFDGLRQVFEEHGQGQWCALGSVKSQIGHTKAAAGAAGLFKIVMALHHKVLPPTIKIDEPNPKLDIDQSPFYLNTRRRPWVRGSTHPRRASVSSFGFGGSNFHLACEEYTGSCVADRLRVKSTEVVVFSGATADDVVRALRTADTRDLPWLARSSQAAFRADQPVRVAVVANHAADLGHALADAAEQISKRPRGSWTTPTGICYSAEKLDGKTAFLFPGQGSQYLRMGEEVACTYDAARAAWDAAADADLPIPIHDVVFPPTRFDGSDPEAHLVETEWAQPAIGVASLALLGVVRELGLVPDCVAGHSFGEVTALHAAGALTAADVVRVARRRGELMRDAARHPGAMCAIQLPIDAARALIEGTSAVIANHNAPDQVVVSGTVEAIEAVERAAAAKNLVAKRLQVATAFHSHVVSDSTAPFSDFLASVDVAPPALPVYANATAEPYRDDVRSTLASQIASPVRFVEIIEAMYANGVRTFVEVGPGRVLTGLVGKILERRPHVATALDPKGKEGALDHALAQLAVSGHTLRWDALWKGFRAPTNPAEASIPKLKLRLTGSNHGKPYPPPEGSRGLPRPNPETPSVDPAAAQRLSAVEAENSALRAELDRARQQPQRAHQAQVSSAAPTVLAPVGAADPWLAAYMEAQRQTADAHAAWQRAMNESHLAFLATMERGMSALAGQPLAPAMFAPAPAAPAPAVISASAAAPAPAVFAPAPAMSAPAGFASTPAMPTAPAAAARPESAPRPMATPSGPALPDLSAVLLYVVAEKTGYPADMLGMEMQLESDLGIDSIKRVEILSAVREAAPGLPEIDAGAMARLQTLGQIVEHLGAHLGATAMPAASQTASLAKVPPASAPRGSAPQAGATDVDLRAILLSVVAEKTGYPAEMLGMEMQLESDLGIDSIKRVEILSAVREAAPGLPEIDAGAMAKLQTLGQIVQHLGEAAPAAVHGEPELLSGGVGVSGRVDVADPVAASGGVDLKAVLLRVVAEKTGYPAEMLGMEMQLESDLGIDSIKRVEILSAVREAAPGLPEIDAGAMARLQTLGQIVAYLDVGGDHAGLTGSAPRPDERHAEDQASSAKEALGRFGLEWVETPPLGLGMAGLSGVRLCVLDRESGVGAALVAVLHERGMHAEVVDEVPAGAEAVVYLGGLAERCDPFGLHRDAFLAAKAIAHAARPVLVTVADSTGPRYGLGGLSGLCKTAALEWPDSSCKAIDLERGGRNATALAQGIADEILLGGPEIEVRVGADGTRRTPRTVASGADGSAPLHLGPDDVVVATGGARGVTASTLVELARQVPCRFVLLGRTALAEEPVAAAGKETDAALKAALLADARSRGEHPSPAQLARLVDAVRASREIRATVAQLEKSGAKAVYLSVDATDTAALNAALASVRERWGAIHVVVHGAGVLADKAIVDKTPEQFDTVFRTKVAGLEALLHATEQDPLKAVLLFSSVAGRCGNPGQCDYAAANQVLDRAAEHLATARPQAVVRALAWGPWEGGMVTPALKRHFESLGVPLIPLEVGARWMVDELRSKGMPNVALGGWPRPLSAGSAPRLRASRRLHASTDAWLHDHSVNGTPVLPMACAMDWIARAATALCPSFSLRTLSEVRVLKGVTLPRFSTTGHWLSVEVEQLSNGHGATISAELKGADGTLHYGALVELAEELAEPPAVPEPPNLDRYEQPLYGGVLFHGPALQVIEEVQGLSAAGARAVLAPGDLGRRLDVHVLDGGLQLALLWTEAVLGGASLPTSIGSVHCYAPLPWSGPVTCHLRANRAKGSRADCDLLFEAGGSVVARVAGVETHLLPAKSPTAVATA